MACEFADAVEDLLPMLPSAWVNAETIERRRQFVLLLGQIEERKLAAMADGAPSMY